jgi:hypothetical protein
MRAGEAEAGVALVAEPGRRRKGVDTMARCASLTALSSSELRAVRRIMTRRTGARGRGTEGERCETLRIQQKRLSGTPSAELCMATRAGHRAVGSLERKRERRVRRNADRGRTEGCGVVARRTGDLAPAAPSACGRCADRVHDAGRIRMARTNRALPALTVVGQRGARDAKRHGRPRT